MKSIVGSLDAGDAETALESLRDLSSRKSMSNPVSLSGFGDHRRSSLCLWHEVILEGLEERVPQSRSQQAHSHRHESMDMSVETLKEQQNREAATVSLFRFSFINRENIMPCTAGILEGRR